MDKISSPKVIPFDPAERIQGRMEQRDNQFLDPTERAEAVTEFLMSLASARDAVHVPEDLHWDLVCFACQYMAGFALSSQDAEVIEAAKLINRYVFAAHYSFPADSPSLGESREARLKYWIRLKERRP